MTSSTSCLNKAGLSLLLALVLMSGCAGRLPAAGEGTPAGGRKARVVVLPVHNLTGGPAPLKDIRASAEKMLGSGGLDVVDDAAIEKAMAAHRIRYTGGIDHEGAAAFREELGADAVLITTVEHYSEANPPKISVNMRLDNTGAEPAILWTDTVGMAGDDHPGLLLLGLIEDPKVLTEKALGRLTGSLMGYLSGGDGGQGCPPGGKYGPKVFYRSPSFNPGGRYSVAVLPFLNTGERKNAGEILALEFVRQLSTLDNITVVEPGLVREKLLSYRVIMEGGVSLDTAGVVLDTLEADLVLSGNVLDYEDYQGLYGTAKIGFSALMIERKDRAVVWESRSYDEGDENVYFFDVGKLNTTGQLACRMIGSVIGRMAAKR